VIPTVATGVLIFARLAGLLMVLPGVSSRAVPGFARLVLAMPLTLLLLPAASDRSVPAALSTLFAQIAGEALLGVAMGFCVSLVFSSLSTAADVISAQSGLQIASMLDPLTMSQPGAAGVLVTWLGTGIFFGGNLHLRCLIALGDSLHSLPPGQVVSAFGAGSVIVPLGGVVLSTGIQLAGPIIAFVFCVNLGLSLLGRMAPGVQLFFAVGPTLTVAASLVLLAVTLPALLNAWYGSLPIGFDVLASLLASAG